MPLLNLKFKKQYSVAVFCGAQNGRSPAYKKAAEELGALIAKNKWRLVYGAGGVGLMGSVARAALRLNGPIYAVTEKVVATWEKPLDATRYRTAPTLEKRKLEFTEHADAFICLPGGAGTIDEFMNILTKKYIAQRHSWNVKKPEYFENRPIVLINTNGFWAPTVAMLKKSIAEGFMAESDLELFKVAKNAKEAVDYINTARKAERGQA
ncbi:MAG: TIGR00730 family Rossman fold protein [Rickettsiales bacterium]|jgi:uncharacterized protein (TIGR00730 family)|nr:TIGR00730 family Rossman fold protein [Rickettsiales bacterium]